MIRGVGLYRSLQGKSDAAAKSIEDAIAQHVQAAMIPPLRATMVMTKNRVVLVEEWTSQQDYDAYVQGQARDDASSLDQKVAPYISEPPTREFFPHALHIRKPLEDDSTSKNIGMLVRQATNSPENAVQLRAAQREAYERQMGLEPGCTCCIILSESREAPHQIRIIELWRTMEDLDFHENSEWHAQGEEKVVPLVRDMDCDFVDGRRLLA